MTVVAAETVTVQVSAVPLQPPPVQPPKVTPALGLAVSVTLVPASKVAGQDLLPVPELAVVQDRPAGAEVTEPVAAARALVSVTVSCAGCQKVAVTARAALMLTVQVDAVPVHAPLQPFRA